MKKNTIDKIADSKTISARITVKLIISIVSFVLTLVLGIFFLTRFASFSRTATERMEQAESGLAQIQEVYDDLATQAEENQKRREASREEFEAVRDAWQANNEAAQSEQDTPVATPDEPVDETGSDLKSVVESRVNEGMAMPQGNQADSESHDDFDEQFKAAQDAWSAAQNQLSSQNSGN